MAHIRKHPVTGKPQVRWRDPSGRERSKTFLRSTDARAFAAEIEHEISRGTLFDRSRSKTPFSVAAAAWLEGRVALRRSSWVRDEFVSHRRLKLTFRRLRAQSPRLKGKACFPATP